MIRDPFFENYINLIKAFISIISLIFSFYAVVKARDANKINFESNSDWRKKLLAIAGFSETNESGKLCFNNTLKAALELRSCARFELPKDKNVVYKFQEEFEKIIIICEQIQNGLSNREIDEKQVKDKIHQLNNRIRGLARLYLKISWEANQPQTSQSRKEIREFKKHKWSLNKRDLLDAKYRWATEVHYKEFLKIHKKLDVDSYI
ncbi:hypothetical protein PT126_05305 [Erysipelothrix rhusiopathiae]|nr:hypothetical protein [Erysipelothrix rhusiopathiae]